MAEFSVHDVYYSYTDNKSDKAKLIHQSWTMAGCEQFTEWYLKNGPPGYYWYGPHDPKYKWSMPVAKIIQRLPTWEFVVVPRHPEA